MIRNAQFYARTVKTTTKTDIAPYPRMLLEDM